MGWFIGLTIFWTIFLTRNFLRGLSSFNKMRIRSIYNFAKVHTNQAIWSKIKLDILQLQIKYRKGEWTYKYLYVTMFISLKFKRIEQHCIEILDNYLTFIYFYLYRSCVSI